MSEAKRRMPGRSMGLKLLLVCGLAAMMSLVALFVFLLLNDRTNRAREVVAEVGGLVGGPQTFLGPVVAVPYLIPAADPKAPPSRGVQVLYPTDGKAEVSAESELRKRSLFKVPVYVAKLNFTAQFDLTDAVANAPQGAQLDWSRAELMVGASDARGAQSDVVLKSGAMTLPAGRFLCRKRAIKII